MKDTSSTAFGGKATPATSPMNLTCTTVATTGAAAPALLQIVINPAGRAKGPDPGWSTYLAPDSAKNFELRDVSSGQTFKINGAGIAIYVKE